MPHASTNDNQGTEHSYRATAFHTFEGIPEGDYSRRNTLALETRIRQYFHLDAQRGSRLLRRRSHRRHEYCHPNSLLHLCHRHRFGTGIPATLRILLWCTSLQSCKRSLHLLYQVRHDLPYRLRCSRICLCRIHHHSLQRRERSGECGNSSPALAGTQLSTRGLHRIDQYAHADH